MINNHLIAQIERNFGLQPTEEQQIALQKLAEFLLSVRPDGLQTGFFCLKATPEQVKARWLEPLCAPSMSWVKNAF